MRWRAGAGTATRAPVTAADASTWRRARPRASSLGFEFDCGEFDFTLVRSLGGTRHQPLRRPASAAGRSSASTPPSTRSTLVRRDGRLRYRLTVHDTERPVPPAPRAAGRQLRPQGRLRRRGGLDRPGERRRMSPLLVIEHRLEYRTDDRSRLHVTGITDLLDALRRRDRAAPRAARQTTPPGSRRCATSTTPTGSTTRSSTRARPGRARRARASCSRRCAASTASRSASAPRPARSPARSSSSRRAATRSSTTSRSGRSSPRGMPFYSPRYPNNASLSSTPGFIVLHLDTTAGDLVLPSGAPNPGGEPVDSPPFPVAEGFSPFTTDHGAYEHLKAALEGKTLPARSTASTSPATSSTPTRWRWRWAFPSIIHVGRGRFPGIERDARAAGRRARPAAGPGRNDDGVGRVRSRRSSR